MLKCCKIGLVAVAFVLAMALPALANEKEESKNEQRIKLEDCPAVVQQTIKDNAAGGQIEYVEKETKAGKVAYEADVKKADGKEVEVKVADDGKLLGVKSEEEKDKDKDKDESNEK